jgi:hypothetical protein
MNFTFGPDNRLYSLARSGKRLTNPIVAVLMSIIVLIVCVILFGILRNIFVLPLLGDEQTRNASAMLSGLAELIGYTMGFLPVLLLLWLWVSFYERRSFATLGLERNGALVKFMRGVGLGALTMIVWTGLSLGMGGVRVENGAPHQQGAVAIGGVVLALLARLIQSPAEEIIFRGWVLPTVGARTRTWIAVIVSSFAFAIPHSLDLDRSPLAIVNIALFGVFLACYALYEGSIWGVCGWHVAYNWTQFNLFGFGVTPQETAGGAIINLEYTTSNPLVTSGYVAEDGLLATLIMSVNLIVLLVLARRRWRNSDRPIIA